MWKSFAIFIFYIIAIFFGFFGVAEAKNIKDVRFALADPAAINEECRAAKGHAAVDACYLALDPPRIIIRSDIPLYLLPYALDMQVGYYFIDGAPTEILQTLFAPGVASIKNPTIKDYFNRAAGDFALWVMGHDIGKAKTDFFLSRMAP